MSSQPIQLYSMLEIDKKNDSRGTDVGQWILCISVKDDSDSSAATAKGGVASFEIYDTREHAVARADALRVPKVTR